MGIRISGFNFRAPAIFAFVLGCGLLATGPGANPLRAQAPGDFAFSSTNLIHFPSTNPLGKDALEVIFFHRFGSAKTGFKDFLGLDDGANMQVSLDYGFTEKLSLGIARTSDFKTYELRGKYALLQQRAGGSPVSLSLYGVFAQETSEQEVSLGQLVNSAQLPNTGNTALNARLAQLNTVTYELTYRDRQNVSAAVLISRKFSPSFSLQLTPMFTHRNFVKTRLKNDRWGLGIGGRWKFSKRLSLLFSTVVLPERDYIGDDYRVEDRRSYGNVNNLTAVEINTLLGQSPNNLAQVLARNIIYDRPVDHLYIPASLALDIETGGHIFQIVLSNARRLGHTQILRGADFDYFRRDYVLGFNMSRLFWFGGDSDPDDSDPDDDPDAND